MEFFGIPVFYTPYLQHPDPTVDRRSGFLAPTVGTSDFLGYALEVPYFWAMGDTKDLTIAPILSTDQGIDLTGEYRSEEHTSELQSLMRISYAVFCFKNKNTQSTHN